jgi:hypothetical protein
LLQLVREPLGSRVFHFPIVEMDVGMIADLVSRVANLPRDRGVFFDLRSFHKKSRANVPFLKKCQKCRRDRPRAVIERERDFFFLSVSLKIKMAGNVGGGRRRYGDEAAENDAGDFINARLRRPAMTMSLSTNLPRQQNDSRAARVLE